ncbi:MAG: hypothetical protein N2235_16210 [Fischerella sp.]|nr:hypothetical protein [Fischerella sp.]
MAVNSNQPEQGNTVLREAVLEESMGDGEYWEIIKDDLLCS